LDRQLEDELFPALHIALHQPATLFAAPQDLFPVIAFLIVNIIINARRFVNIFFAKIRFFLFCIKIQQVACGFLFDFTKKFLFL